MSVSFVIPWTVACQGFSSWDFPGRNTGVGYQYSRGSSHPWIEPLPPALAGRLFTTESPEKSKLASYNDYIIPISRILPDHRKFNPEVILLSDLAIWLSPVHPKFCWDTSLISLPCLIHETGVRLRQGSVVHLFSILKKSEMTRKQHFIRKVKGRYGLCVSVLYREKYGWPYTSTARSMCLEV